MKNFIAITILSFVSLSANAFMNELQILPGTSVIVTGEPAVKVSCSGSSALPGHDCFLRGGCILTLSYEDRPGRGVPLRSIDGLCGSVAEYQAAKAKLLKSAKEMQDNGFCARFTNLAP